MIAIAPRNPHKISEVGILRVLSSLGRMEAQEFCDRWFGDDEELKGKRGYRANCARLLSQILGVEFNTVDSWGKNFERMPKEHQRTLLFADGHRASLKLADKTGMLDEYLKAIGKDKN